VLGDRGLRGDFCQETVGITDLVVGGTTRRGDFLTAQFGPSDP